MKALRDMSKNEIEALIPFTVKCVDGSLDADGIFTVVNAYETHSAIRVDIKLNNGVISENWYSRRFEILHTKLIKRTGRL